MESQCKESSTPKSQSVKCNGHGPPSAAIPYGQANGCPEGDRGSKPQGDTSQDLHHVMVELADSKAKIRRLRQDLLVFVFYRVFHRHADAL